MSSRHFPLESFYFSAFLHFYYFMAWTSSRPKTNLLITGKFPRNVFVQKILFPIRLKRIKRRPNSSLIIYSLHTSIYFCTELTQAESIILIKVFLFLLARSSRLVRSTPISLSPLPLSSAINESWQHSHYNYGNVENQTWGSWVRSASATSVPRTITVSKMATLVQIEAIFTMFNWASGFHLSS